MSALPELEFRLLESRDADGVLRMVAVGELDLAVVDQLSARLQQLISARVPVRLDLSRLEFIDSSGIHALVRGVSAGRCGGIQLVQVERELRRNVRHMIDLVGIASLLWPENGRGT